MLSIGEGLYTVDLWWFESSNEGIIFQPSFIIIIITTNRYISPLFKAMCPTKWSRLYRPFLTSATLSGMMYTAPKASVCYEMHLIVFTSTVRSTKWVVFAQMDLTCLDLMRQSTIYTHLRIWCTQWTLFLHHEIKIYWSSKGTLAAVRFLGCNKANAHHKYLSQ